MIKLQQKETVTIAIMTGSFHTDYSRMMADAICEGLAQEGKRVDIFLMQGIDATRYLNFNAEIAESFDHHYYAQFEYAKYVKPDLLIISFATISAVPSAMHLDAFLKPFEGVPVILLEDDTPLDNGISITVDNYRGMYDCVEHLIKDHGCKRIVYVSGPEDVPDAAKRLQAYRDAMKDNDLPVRKDMIGFGDFSDKVDDLVASLFKHTPNADAVCCANDEMAESAYRVLVPRGLYPGTDIAVTGFDDTESARFMNPPLTTVRQDFHAVADAVVKSVHRLLNGEEVSSEIVPAKLIRRGSCTCLHGVTRTDKKKEKEKRDQALGGQTRIKNLQKQSMTSALLMRGVLTKDITPEVFFYRFGNMLSDMGTIRSCVYMLETPAKADGKTQYFLPEKLKPALVQNGKDVTAYKPESAPVLDAEEIAKTLKGHETFDRQTAVFPLFCEDEHYGALFVELNRDDMVFYYSLAMEIGTGIRYLLMQNG